MSPKPTWGPQSQTASLAWPFKSRPPLPVAPYLPATLSIFI